MSMPIGYYERIVNAGQGLRWQQTGGAEIIVNTRGSNPNSDEYPAIFNFLLNEVPHRFVDVGQPARVYPAASHIQIDYAPMDQQRPSKRGVISSKRLRYAQANSRGGCIDRAVTRIHPVTWRRLRRAGKMACHCCRRRSIQ